MTTINLQCSKCYEKEDIFNCQGCAQILCFKHLTDHREMIKIQYNEMADHLNCLQETIHEEKPCSFIDQITQWKNDSIERIEQIADNYQRKVINYRTKSVRNIEKELNHLMKELEETSRQNKFNEIHLNKLKRKINKTRRRVSESTQY